MFAERKVEVGASAFAAQAAAVPGTAAEREAIAARVGAHRGVPAGAVRAVGMMLFPASNDLITMFVALEILSLPLYLLCGLARRRRLLSQEAALKYFLLGALSSAFFLYGAALLYGYAGLLHAVARSTTRCAPAPRADRSAARRDGAARRRAAVQVRRRAVPLLDAGRLRRRADAGHRLHGGLHQDRRHRRADAGVLRRRSAATAGTGSR